MILDYNKYFQNTVYLHSADYLGGYFAKRIPVILIIRKTRKYLILEIHIKLKIEKTPFETQALLT